MPNIFQRLSRERPVEEKTQQQPREQAGVLLAWLDKWPKSVLTLKDLRNFSPRSIRDKETAIRAAQILTAHGWLSQLEPHRWKIIRQPLTPTSSQ